jgi:hypothetical protein
MVFRVYLTGHNPEGGFTLMSRKVALGCSLAALAAMAGLGAAEKALKSGLQPGDKTTPFHVRDITGPKKGTSLCYV